MRHFPVRPVARSRLTSSSHQAHGWCFGLVGFGGGLTAGMDVTSTFETTADNTFSGAAEFQFDAAKQTLYFSADDSQASANAVAAVQAGAVINPHDILIV